MKLLLHKFILQQRILPNALASSWHFPCKHNEIVYKWVADSINRKNSSISSLGTIYALATSRARSAVALVRISGNETLHILQTLSRNTKALKPRHAYLRKLYIPSDDHDNVVADNCAQLIDEAIVIYYSQPNSYTGEDVGELHVHGSTAVLSTLFTTLATKFRNCRPAERGEFSRRALLNGKLNLTQVEAVADLIAAETNTQRVQALRNTKKHALSHHESSISACYETWTRSLLQACAHLDAIIDFGDEEDFHADVDNIERNVMQNVARVQHEIEQHLRHYDIARKIRSGFSVALIGSPNVGKSSIINTLLRRQASIVSPIPGTTRDIIESFCEIGGYPVVLSDTAGVRHMQQQSSQHALIRTTAHSARAAVEPLLDNDEKLFDPIEAEGIERAIERAREADVIVYVVDAEQFSQNDELLKFLSNPSETVVKRLVSHGIFSADDRVDGTRILTVLNKSDLMPSAVDDAVSKNKSNVIFVSCKHTTGFEQLAGKLEEKLRQLCDSGGGSMGDSAGVVTRQRQRDLLVQCLHYLQSFCALFSVTAARGAGASEGGSGIVLAVNELRLALDELAKLVGKGGISTDELLDQIFNDFCIGK